MVKNNLLALLIMCMCAEFNLAVAADKPESAVAGKPELAVANKPESAVASKPEIYRLHQGDTLEISVWKENDLQKPAVVLPDGSITFPLAGRLEVVGLSTTEAEQLIAAKLKTYLPDPTVSVVISGIAGNTAYVLGKVIHPGSIVINGPLSVLQAISTAGGFDKFADEGGIKVIRENSNHQSLLSVNYKNIISGKDMSTNIQLKANDTIVVP